MPDSPELAEVLAKQTLDLYLQAEQTMLGKVAKRVARGIDEEGWAERKLAEAQALRREAETVVAQLTSDTPDVVEAALRKAYNRGVATAGTDLRKAGVSETLAFGRVKLDAVDALIDETVTTVQSTHLRILRSTLDGYRQVIAEAGGQVTTGTLTRLEAAQSALDRFGGHPRLPECGPWPEYRCSWAAQRVHLARIKEWPRRTFSQEHCRFGRSAT